MTAPIIYMHHRIAGVRDDLFLGGTKARFIAQVFDGVHEAVYASPPEGGAQTAIATVARRLGKRATIFVAARTRPHPRTLKAARLGAKVVPISPGYLSVVQSRAREYCRNTGSSLTPSAQKSPARSRQSPPRPAWLHSSPKRSGAPSGPASLPAASPPRSRKPAATSSRSAATSTRAKSAGLRSTFTPANSATEPPWPRPSRPIRTTTRRLGSCAAPRAGRGGLFWNVAPLARG